MPLMNKAQYARHRKELNLPGGSAPAVTYAVRDGRIRCDNEGMIDVEQADKDWAANTSQIASVSGVKAGAARAAQRKNEAPRPLAQSNVEEMPAPQPSRTDLNTSRAAKEYYEAELSRLKFEEKEGTLIPATLVRKVLYEAGRIIRAGHDDIVAQLAPELASETVIDAVERLLKTGLDRLDNQFADKIQHLEESLLAADQSEPLDEAA